MRESAEFCSRRVLKFKLLALILAMMIPMSTTFAQESGPSVLEEIVVTAQKRSQNIQDVPISISAISGETQRRRGLNSVADLSNSVPNLIVSDFGNPVITIINVRGVSQFDFGDHQESPIAVYADGAYVPYLAGVGSSIYDIDRLEVLRGPQGTLFGRNATGGLLHIISARPTTEFEGYANVSAGNYGSIRAEGAISGEIGGGWLGRLSVLSDSHDGYFQNSAGPDKGNGDNLSWRLQLLKDIGDNAEAHLVVRGSNDDVSTSPFGASAAYPHSVIGINDGLISTGDTQAHSDFCEAYFGFPVAPGSVDCVSGDIDDGDPFTISNNQDGNGFERNYISTTLTVTVDFDDVQLTSITSVGDMEKDYGVEDSDGTSYETVNFGQFADVNDLSQELRLSGSRESVTWVAGIYYLNIDGDYASPATFFQGDPSFEAGLRNSWSTETTSWAVFGQVDFDISDRTTLTAGLRWTEDDKEMQFDSNCVGVACDLFGFNDPSVVQGSGFNDNVPGAQTERSSDNWDAKLSLSHQATDDVSLFASVSRGTKAGGYNGGAFANYTLDQMVFDDEELTAFELGVKSILAEGRVRLNTGVFYYDYTDVQVFNQFGVNTVTFNNDGEVTGAEFELQASPRDGLILELNVAYLDTEIDPVEYSDILSGEVFSSKQELVNAPGFTLNGLARNEWEFGENVLAIQVDGSWVDDKKLNLIDHPATREDGFALVNARVSYGDAGGDWEVALYGRNLADEKYRVAAIPILGDAGTMLEVYGPPQTYGASLLIRF